MKELRYIFPMHNPSYVVEPVKIFFRDKAWEEKFIAVADKITNRTEIHAYNCGWNQERRQKLPDGGHNVPNEGAS